MVWGRRSECAGPQDRRRPGLQIRPDARSDDLKWHSFPYRKVRRSRLRCVSALKMRGQRAGAA